MSRRVGVADDMKEDIEKVGSLQSEAESIVQEVRQEMATGRPPCHTHSEQTAAGTTSRTTRHCRRIRRAGIVDIG